jgi:4-oxalocrotonate tautomerase
MPYIELKIDPAPTARQAFTLASGITDVLEVMAGKRRELIAVRVDGTRTALWTIGGKRVSKATAYLEIKISEGSNSREEKEALVAHLHGLLTDTLGDLAEASYITFHEIPAQSWGYAGLTQEARASEGGTPINDRSYRE